MKQRKALNQLQLCPLRSTCSLDDLRQSNNKGRQAEGGEEATAVQTMLEICAGWSINYQVVEVLFISLSLVPVVQWQPFNCY